ncbi:hypothetical protein L1987_07489 [Smallanthus sonchifolius]|uniref:Uncharacterized protein n=1 Tax=Smallanthus sonchifolius TaxID=185202 RepID=A0ACB9K0I3_9ASTR|nr:hypothetical protein L1987_07489 [Smallanthus sonchifolius]
MKSYSEISRNRSSGTISISSIRNLLPRSGAAKNKISSNPKISLFNAENVPPEDVNMKVNELPSIASVSGKGITDLETRQHDEAPFPADPHVKEDVFQLVGVSMVKSAMSGYNTSMLAYGQTGSGKTYTLWGPPSAMLEDQSAGGIQGIVPRIFQMLFAEIQRQQDQAEGKQINYQCRCSLLEIYNEQIGDLLDPTQRNLVIKDDAKHGFYVENLTEKYVTDCEDVTQILIKGLSNRKVGATSINSKSSRSHVVFTCVIESWCKGTASNNFGGSKTSRITLVDLAGLEDNRINDAGSECVKEGEFVKKSISQLGYVRNLVNILAGTNQSRISKDIPYNDSCLTHLLRESLGGNSKLTVICAISPDDNLNRSLIFPQFDTDLKEEVNIDEHYVKDLQLQFDMLHSSCDDEFQEISMGGCEADMAGEQYASCQEDGENEEINSEELETDAFNDPTFSESPKLGNAMRKSAVFSQDNVAQEPLKISNSLRSSKMFVGPTESLAASLQRGLEVIDNHQRSSVFDRSLVSFSFDHLATNTNVTNTNVASDGSSKSKYICSNCQQRVSNDVEESFKTWVVGKNNPGHSYEVATENIKKVKDLENLCKEQAAEIEKLNNLVLQYKQEKEGEMSLLDELRNGNISSNSKSKVLRWNDEPEIINHQTFDADEKESLLEEIKSLRTKSIDRSRSSLSLLSQSLHLRKSNANDRPNDTVEQFQKERERWMEMESEWICLTDELRVDLDAQRRRYEAMETELRSEKKRTEELDEALMRSIDGHGKMVEHYADLQEKYTELVEKHRLILEGIAEVKRAAAKAGEKGRGKRFSKSLAAELSVLRVEREKERELLKKENRSLKVQLRDTVEAVHAAGELLVRLREAEEAAAVAQENYANIQEESDKLKKKIDKQKRKHKLEMITMKQYLAEDRLPESALRPFYREEEDSDVKVNDNDYDDDQAWRAEFGAIYQDHY